MSKYLHARIYVSVKSKHCCQMEKNHLFGQKNPFGSWQIKVRINMELWFSIIYCSTHRHHHSVCIVAWLSIDSINWWCFFSVVVLLLCPTFSKAHKTSLNIILDFLLVQMMVSRKKETIPMTIVIVVILMIILLLHSFSKSDTVHFQVKYYWIQNFIYSMYVTAKTMGA